MTNVPTWAVANLVAVLEALHRTIEIHITMSEIFMGEIYQNYS